MKLLAIFGLLCFYQSYHQVDCTGVSYALTCGALYAEDMNGDCVVMINANVTTTATIRTFSGNIVLDVVPGTTSSYSMGGELSVTEGVETKTFYVDSAVPIEVHVSNEGSLSPYYVMDAVEAQAVTDVDTEYYVINYGDGFNGCPGYTAFYTVAALNSVTTVSVYERSDAGGMTLRQEVDLNRFQCFSERADISGTEPTGDGFLIRSTGPVSVYSGNRCAREELDVLYHSTWSALPSVSYLGDSYITYPLTTAFDSPGGSYGVKVVATQNNTLVTTSLGQSGTIDQGESTFVWYEYGTGEHVGGVTCSSTCLVLQMVNGTSLDTGVSQTIIMPEYRMITSGVFSTPDFQQSTVDHYLHVIHPTGSGVVLDDVSLDSEGWVAHAGMQYLETSLTEGYHEVYSTSEAFSALVTGITDSASGYMMNVNTDVFVPAGTTASPPGSTTPPGNSSAPQPQKVVPLDGVFTSASGEDFTLDCSSDYNDALQDNVEQMAVTVNGLIGNQLCSGQTLNDMQVVTHTSTFTPTGNNGTNRISYYLLVGLDQTEAAAEACASEISDWLIPHENWQEIVPVLPDCPEVVFTSDQWTHTGNDWVCYSQYESDSAPVATVLVTSLTYDLEMSGRFDTESGEALTAECTETYTESLLQSTISQRSDVNALLGSELCSGMAISLGVPTARLNSVGSTGETYQDYPFELSALAADTELRDVTDCASEVSAYLAPHSNWQQPIIPPAAGCPTLVFQNEEFVEEMQRWVCVQE